MPEAAIAAGGLPSLPDEWRGLLLATPLDGGTLEADRDGGTWIDRGAEHGVRIDLELYVLGVPIEADWERMYPGATEDQPLEVVEVEPQRSRVRYRYAADKRAPIPAGLLVTSRDPTVRGAE
jgi:hypothetical protein